MAWSIKKIRRLNIATHRDLGYIFSALIIVYCVSGIALNHVDDWDPDFILNKKDIEIGKGLNAANIKMTDIERFNRLVGESEHKIYDFPTTDQVKIYYKDASFHINFSTGKGVYEQVAKRHVFYEFNAIHRNSLKGWKWASDVFGLMLITITITGLFILKGKHSLGQRGKWLIAAGLVPIVVFIVILAYK